MAEDPLAQFRKRPTEAAKRSTDAPGEPDVYEAFKAVDRRQLRLQIRPAHRAWERITYSYLLRIVEDGSFGTEIALVYTFCVVIIKGRNLKLIAEAIDNERCDLVQQFDPEKWEKPADPTAPFIETIEIHVETRVEASDKALSDIQAARAKH